MNQNTFVIESITLVSGKIKKHSIAYVSPLNAKLHRIARRLLSFRLPV
ncbi:MAG: hypothetical protein J6V99_05655 [Neisseriaceae bacterium]|nr:hypothetical protein [Neisseriaceae bacterium]